MLFLNLARLTTPTRVLMCCEAILKLYPLFIVANALSACCKTKQGHCHKTPILEYSCAFRHLCTFHSIEANGWSILMPVGCVWWHVSVPNMLTQRFLFILVVLQLS